MSELSTPIVLVGGLVVLLVIAAAVRVFSRAIRLPFSVLLVLVGAALSGVFAMAGVEPEFLSGFDLSADLILFVFLPALVFESAIHFDVRELRKNVGAILTLAIPGMLISTGLTGLFVHLVTPLELSLSFLLGAVLSATDPVAVIAVFKRVGAPRRLLVLVEGESLFNDATSIVVARLIGGMVVAGTFAVSDITAGIADFGLVFGGGIGVGLAFGALAGIIFSRIESDSAAVITLTIISAYGSFLIAEELLGVSGVMATVSAGLVFSGWGWMKIEARVREHLRNLWEYVSFFATALIFLLVGFGISFTELAARVDLILWTFLGMLIARAAITYGLIPIVNRLGSGPGIDISARSILFWGGLRGAVALALVFSLPDFAGKAELSAIVVGAVVMTLVVHGLTISPLVRLLGLDTPSRTDRLLRAEGELQAKQAAHEQIDELTEGGMFSSSVVEALNTRYRREIDELKETIEELYQEGGGSEQERKLLYLAALAAEKSVYLHLFTGGHLREASFRELQLTINLQVDAIRYVGDLKHVKYTRLGHRRIERALLSIFDSFVPLRGLAERIRRGRMSLDYELAWAHYRGSRNVLSQLDSLQEAVPVGREELENVREQYTYWNGCARDQLESIGEQFPEFAVALQRRIGRRLLLQSEQRSVEDQNEEGILPDEIAETLLEEISRLLRELRGGAESELSPDPATLLRKVPLFESLPEHDFTRLVDRVSQRTCPPGDTIIHQGDRGDTLYVIARGVVRVNRQDNGSSEELASLIGGDFFGEMALLHDEKRNADVVAKTPCLLYELRRDELEHVMQTSSALKEAVLKRDAERREKLEKD
jgi:CPA1 family monovalent cation:H+ antiporter